MTRTSVRNSTENLLCMFLEPWGTDHWLRPGEHFTVVAEEGEPEPDEPPFTVVVHKDGISVWVNYSENAEIIDDRGNPVECGHQRPLGAFD